jgi:protein-tyrosine kinase
MSRIYEAMKKAESDQLNVQTKDLEPARVDPIQENGTQDLHLPGFSELSKLPLLSSVGADAPLGFNDLQKRCTHPQWNPDAISDVFANPAFAFGAEQFRTLRSRLYQFRSNQPLRTILVTSSMAGEGKTFVASNLAHAIVRQPDCRALLIDADLRCSRLHLMLGAPAAPGLSDYLQGSADESAIIQFAQENSLGFISAGTGVTNPSELLANGRLKSLLNRVGPAFDWVVIDSPPCLSLADASILADLCDGVLLVARAGSTIGEVAQRASREIQARKTLLGVVLNAVEQVSESDSYKLYDKRQQPERGRNRPPKGLMNSTLESGVFSAVEER